MTPLIEVTGLVAGHAGVPAVRGLELEVHAGDVVTLLGPNGAGKSTTLATLAGLLPPLGGTVDVLGSKLPARGPDVLARRGLTLVPEDRGIFHQLTVAENLRLRQRRRSSTTTDEVFDYFPALGPLQGRRAGLLSGGEQQMLALAGALLSEPKVLLLDEISLGLAPIIVSELLPKVRSIARNRGLGVLLVEQHVHAALAVADYAYLLSHGDLVAQGPAATIDTTILELSYLGSS